MKLDAWIVYTLLAGLSWGVYVPLIFFGGSELGGKPNSRLLAILCVGVAYFVIAVLVPVVLFATGTFAKPDFKTSGLVFSSLAGVAGAVGAICVIFATQNAVALAKASPDAPNYKLYIAPLIFGLAPVINTLVSLVWHPTSDNPWHFELKQAPRPELIVGIVLVGLGAGLVLFSKEKSEVKPATPAAVPGPGTPAGS